MTLHLITHPSYSFDFPGNHRFPMEKFRLLHEYLQSIGIATHKNTLRPGRIRQELLEQVHHPAYVTAFVEGSLTEDQLKSIGLPWSRGLVHRSLISPNGTLLTASLALNHGIACHLAGGTHHAHYDHGSGFCIFNDLAVAAKATIHREKSRGNSNFRALIFDCDVHQGDGTATLLANEPKAFTCSVHCKMNFPANKAVSDLDVEFEPKIGDEEYIGIVQSSFQKALDLSKPDLVLYDAGVDVFIGDPLGRIDVSEDGIRARDEWLLSQCKQLGLPVATVIGGGYDDDRLALARRHAIVVESAARVFQSACG